MATTTVASGNQVTQWAADFFAEYVRESLFAPYMGKSENAIIQVKEELGTKAGKTISLPLVTRLTNAGVTGDSTLEGNEEALGNYNHDVGVDQIRNAVRVGKMEQKHTAIDLLNAARAMLKMWIMDDLRTDIITAMYSPVVDGSTAYASATEAQKDTWVAAQYTSATNTRVLFGEAVGNAGFSDHSADLATIDSTNAVLDYDMVQLAKRLAKKADRHIRPVRVKGQREWFVLFCESYAYRDLKADTETIHQNAGVRGKDNPLFSDADLILDGVTVREVPEIGVLSGVGTSSIDVSGNFLCGAQDIGLAWAQRSEFATDTFDYKNARGVAISEVRGVEKLSHNSVQNGQVTIYAAAVADS